MQADEHQRHRPEDQHYRLHHLGINHRPQSTENRVETGDDDQNRSARPEIESGDGAHDDTAGKERDTDLRQDIADDRHPGEVRARRGVVAPLQEFRHGVHAAAQIERYEQPAEQEEDEAREPLEVTSRESARSSGSRQTNQMLAADVGREEARSYRKPTHISARQKEVRAYVLLFLGRPVRNGRQNEEVRRDNYDVDETEVAHGVRSVFREWTSELKRCPFGPE